MRTLLLSVLLLCQPLLLKAQNTNNTHFPIAVWLQQTSNAKAYRDMGINTYVGIWSGLDARQWEQLVAAEMRLLVAQNDFALSLGNHPLLCGWTLGDEPDNAQWNEREKRYDPCIEPEKIIAQYKRIKEKDPSRPVYLNLGQGVAFTQWVGRGACTGNTSMYRDYIKAADIVSYDIYPVNNNDTIVGGKLWYVAKGIDSLHVWSDHKKPVWCWIETSKIGKDSPRKPTPAEVKTQVWMALIHGVKGFGYFCHSFLDVQDDAAPLHDAEMRQGLTAINREVTALAPALNAPTLPEYASVKVTPGAIPVDIMTKEWNGAHYLFAVAMRPGACEATFRVASGKRVEVIGESRTIKIKKRQFTDTMDSYGVRLYKIL